MFRTFSFRRLLSVVAGRRVDAAKTGSTASAAETPREVILAACEAIAANLSPDGFRFIKSSRRLKRTHGDLTFTIRFQSSKYNSAGRQAKIWIHAAVSSEKLAKAQHAQPMPWGVADGPNAGTFAGGQIGNLRAWPLWMSWDFAHTKTRQREIDHAISAIRRIILPFFALFDDPNAVVERLMRRPSLWSAPLIEYALVAEGREAAEALGTAFLKNDRGLRKSFNLALETFRRDGLPSYRFHLPSELAAIAIANDLDFTKRH